MHAPASPVPTLPTPLLEVRVAAQPQPGRPVVTLDGGGGVGPGAGEAGVDPEIAHRLGMRGEPGELQRLGGPGWLVGIGAGEPRDWRCAGAALARDLVAAGVPEPVTWPVPGMDEPRLGALVLGLLLGSHRYRIGEPGGPAPPVVLVAADLAGLQPTVRAAVESAAATALARDLADTPSDVKSPAWLAGQAARLAGAVPGLRAKVYEEDELAAAGFGGILAVGGGSARPPRLPRLDWAPAGAAPSPYLPWSARV